MVVSAYTFTVSFHRCLEMEPTNYSHHLGALRSNIGGGKPKPESPVTTSEESGSLTPKPSSRETSSEATGKLYAILQSHKYFGYIPYM